MCTNPGGRSHIHVCRYITCTYFWHSGPNIGNCETDHPKTIALYEDTIDPNENPARFGIEILAPRGSVRNGLQMEELHESCCEWYGAAT